jgi:hypothetical protein
MLISAVAVTSASARTFRISNQQLRVTWRRLEFLNQENAVLARCPVTLEGSFHTATIEKVRKALVGYITTVRVARCETGLVTVLTETLPWHLTYESFSGILPNITRIRLLLVNASFLIEVLGARCLARTTVERPASGEAILGAGGRIEGLVPDSSRRIPVRGGLGGFGCLATEGAFRTEAGDPGTVTLLGTSNAVFVTLI